MTKRSGAPNYTTDDLIKTFQLTGDYGSAQDPILFPFIQIAQTSTKFILSYSGKNPNQPTSANQMSTYMVIDQATLTPSKMAHGLDSIQHTTNGLDSQQSSLKVFNNKIFALDKIGKTSNGGYYSQLSEITEGLQYDATLPQCGGWLAPVSGPTEIAIAVTNTGSTGITVYMPKGAYSPTTTTYAITDDGQIKLGSKYP